MLIEMTEVFYIIATQPLTLSEHLMPSVWESCLRTHLNPKLVFLKFTHQDSVNITILLSLQLKLFPLKIHPCWVCEIEWINIHYYKEMIIREVSQKLISLWELSPNCLIYMWEKWLWQNLLFCTLSRVFTFYLCKLTITGWACSNSDSVLVSTGRWVRDIQMDIARCR